MAAGKLMKSCWLFILLCSKSLAHFVFEYEILSVITRVTNCGGDEGSPACETYLSDFCLREGRATLSNDTLDCPLGVGSTIVYKEPYPTARIITSEHPWMVMSPCTVILLLLANMRLYIWSVSEFFHRTILHDHHAYMDACTLIPYRSI